MWNSNPTGEMLRVMFKPNFRYTDKIVSDLAQIAAARELESTFGGQTLKLTSFPMTSITAWGWRVKMPKKKMLN